MRTWVLVVLAGCLGTGLAMAQRIEVSASVSPPQVHSGDTFYIIVHVTQWLESGAAPPEPAVLWPDWQSLGLSPAVPQSVQATNIPFNGQTIATATLTIGLQAQAAGTVQIPAFEVQGAASSATTGPLTVQVLEPGAALAPTAPPAGQPGPTPVPSMPMLPTSPQGSPPWWDDPSLMPSAPKPGDPGQPPAPSREDAIAELQFRVGAFAFPVVLVAVAVAVMRSRRRQAGQ